MLAALFCAPLCAAASPTEFGAGVIVVTGDHHESNGDSHADGVPAPLLHVSHDFGRLQFSAEGIPPIGRVPITGTAIGISGVELTYIGASLRYRLTPRTSAGIGETIYNQQTTYTQEVAAPGTGDHEVTSVLNTNRSRVVGVQYQVVQTLRATPRSNAEFLFAVNPHMTGNVGIHYDYTFSDGNHGSSPWIASPESGSQVDSILSNSIFERHVVLRYGVRYIHLSMHFPDGSLADQNSFLIPFAGLSLSIGR